LTHPPGERGPLRILYFGTFDRAAGRNAILIEGLTAAGVDVATCHVPLWRDTTAKLQAVSHGPGTAAVPVRQLLAWVRLTRAHARAGAYDALVVGATAHLDLPLARRLASRRGRSLVFDPLVSLGETVRDRGLLPARSRRLAMLEALERRLFRLPDLCLADTTAHAEAFQAALGVDRCRLAVVPAGAPSIFRRLAPVYAPRDDGGFRVVYFGQFIPLHGLDVVLHAADRLRDRPDIGFELVGVGQKLAECQASARRLALPNVTFDPAWLPAEVLIKRHIAPADLCLGVFGDQPKAGRVVPFKVYVALAAGRPVLTADTPAVREMLVPGDEVWTVPPADPAALAGAIAQLADRPGVRAGLAARGQAAWEARFAPAVLGMCFRGILEDRVSAHHAR